MGNRLQGKALGFSHELAKAVNIMVGKQMLDRNGNIPYTEKIIGYVCGIHKDDDENEALRGTIDVQEFNCMTEDYDDLDENTPVGFHEGVYISAIQNNKSGYLLVPQMYSEVVIVADPITKKEYVTNFSHVDIIQLESHQSVKIGVTETEDFDEDDDDSPDFDELAPTGKAVHTEYTPDKLIEQATINYDGKGGELEAKDGNYVREVTNQSSTTKIADTYEEHIDAKTKTIKVGNIIINLDGKNGLVELNINNTKISIDKKEGKIAIGDSNSSQIAVDTNGNVILGESSDNAVTYSQLASVLNNLCSYLSTALVATKLGPQPLSTASQIAALPSKFTTFKSNKVKIAK